MKIKVTKIKSILENHPIENGFEYIGFHVDDPIVGHELYVKHLTDDSYFRTSRVKKVNNDGTFETKNSIYKIEKVMDGKEKVNTKKLTMKIFKMNECDWMAAPSKDEAIKEYIEITSSEECDLEVVESQLHDTMWYGFEFDELEEFISNEKDAFIIRGDIRGDYPVALKLAYSKVLELDNVNKPYIIASTEF